MIVTRVNFIDNIEGKICLFEGTRTHFIEILKSAFGADSRDKSTDLLFMLICLLLVELKPPFTSPFLGTA